MCNFMQWSEEPEIGSSPGFENHWHHWQLHVSPSSVYFVHHLLLDCFLIDLYKEHRHSSFFIRFTWIIHIKRNYLCCFCIHLNPGIVHFVLHNKCFIKKLTVSQSLQCLFTVIDRIYKMGRWWPYSLSNM